MKKHRVILDINCDKFIFWPDHCQYAGAIRQLQEKYLSNFTIKNIQDKLNSISKTIKYPELLFYILSEYKGINKIAISSKQILKQEPIPILILSKEKKL